MKQAFGHLVIAVSVIATVASVATAAEVQRDIEYANIDGESQKLDACVPDGDGPHPIAIIVHGGGWSKGDKARDINILFDPLTNAGFTWFSINYRLAPDHRWPACIDDVRTAIRWIKAHAAEFKGDPNRIAIFGYSAGGHLAAFAAATADDATRVQAVVLLAAPVDLETDMARRDGLSPALQALFDHGKEFDDGIRATLKETSATNYLTANMPPCLMIHGTDDASVLHSQSDNLKAKLESLNVPCELVTIPGGGHGIDKWESLDPTYKQTMVNWLRDNLKAAP